MKFFRWLFRQDEPEAMYMNQIQSLKIAAGDGEIKPLALPAIQPLRAVKVDRVERFRLAR